MDELATQCHECLFTIIMSLKRKRSVLSIKDSQCIILRLKKREEGTNLFAEYGVRTPQISDIRKNKKKIIKFPDNLETSAGLKLHMLKGSIKPCLPGLFSNEQNQTTSDIIHM